MGINFLMTGAASKKAAQEEAALAEIRKAQQGKAFRFFMKEGEKGVKITFLDGDLDEDGNLAPPRLYEHTVKHNGAFVNYVCPQKTQPDSGEICPICEDGNNPSLVSLFTVLDHRIVHGTKDPTKIYKDTRKLLVAKPTSAELLATLAVKRGGLAGATFEVFRSGDKSAAIGSSFDFDFKTPLHEIKAKYVRTYQDPNTKKEVKDFYAVPLVYEDEIVFYHADELRKLGFGNGSQSQHTTQYNPGGNSSATASKPAEQYAGGQYEGNSGGESQDNETKWAEQL